VSAPPDRCKVGLESFTESLKEQDAAAIQADWWPPAGGAEGLTAILERTRGTPFGRLGGKPSTHTVVSAALPETTVLIGEGKASEQ